MKKLNCAGKRSLIVIILMALFATAKSQVMWNLKGGWMQRNSIIGESANGEWEKESRPEWMAGLELEIPLNEMLDLQTGLRWRYHKVFVKKDYNFLGIYNGSSYYDPYTTTKTFESKQLAEIPLRLTYKQPLGNNFTVHAGIGPYFSYILDGTWDYYHQTNEKAGGSSQAVWENAKFKDRIHVGLEASVAINWSCLSLGATYNIPCFYKGYKDENKPVVMATLGIRFKSHVWKYVGATLLSIVTVGAAASSAWNAANSSNSSSYYETPSYSNSNQYSSGSSSSSKYNSESQKVNHANWTALERAYSGDESLLMKMKSSGNYDKQEVRRIQQRMKSTRQKIKEQSGHDRQQSPMESWNP